MGEHRVRPAQQVTRRIHPGKPGGEKLVAHHAVAQLEAAALQPLRGRCDPDAHQHRVTHDALTVAQQHGTHATVVLDALHRHTAAHLHPVACVHGCHRSTHLFPEAADQWRRRTLENRHLHAHLCGGRGSLEADEPRTDHHQVRTGLQVGAHSLRVLQRAQHMHTAHHRHVRQRAGTATGGDDHAVGGDCVARRQRDGAGEGIKSGGGGAAHPLQLQCIEHLGLAQRDAFLIHIT